MGETRHSYLFGQDVGDGMPGMVCLGISSRKTKEMPIPPIHASEREQSITPNVLLVLPSPQSTYRVDSTSTHAKPRAKLELTCDESKPTTISVGEPTKRLNLVRGGDSKDDQFISQVTRENIETSNKTYVRVLASTAQTG